MRRIGIVTTSRADFGIYLPILQEMSKCADLDMRVIVSGSHLDQRHGFTVSEITDAGFHIDARIPVLDDDSRAVDIARAVSKGVRGFAEYFEDAGLDILMVLGDRYEMLSAVIAAIPFRLPVAHVHGGEITVGAFDDGIRHAMTKLSHLHFASTETYGARLRQLGEEAWRVVISGAPALDMLERLQPASADELAKAVGLNDRRKPLLVTFHPATLDPMSPSQQVSNLLDALGGIDLPIVFTAPNADPGGVEIRRLIERFVNGRADAVIVPSLGNRLYFSMMHHAAAMVGNSSSGIIEAASFALPVLNIGSRQEGRLAPANVVTVANSAEEIRRGLDRVLSPSFRDGLANLRNPYFRGGAAAIVVQHLATIPLDDRLIVKRFTDMESSHA